MTAKSLEFSSYFRAVVPVPFPTICISGPPNRKSHKNSNLVVVVGRLTCLSGNSGSAPMNLYFSQALCLILGDKNCFLVSQLSRFHFFFKSWSGVFQVSRLHCSQFKAKKRRREKIRLTFYFLDKG